MDKLAANKHYQLMRNEIKKAKAMVAGRLIRKVNSLKKEQEKAEDEKQSEKFNGRIEKALNETKLLKTLDPYELCKKATLNPDIKYWKDVAGNTKSTTEERLTGLVLSKNNIHRQVQKFKSENKDCDEWLEEYFEYREKKKELEIASSTKNKKRKKESTEKEKARDKEPSFKKKFDKKDKFDGNKNKTKKNTQFDNKQGHSKNKNSHAKDNNEDEQLHPSWASKRKEKELLKAALSGQIQQSKRMVLNSEHLK